MFTHEAKILVKRPIPEVFEFVSQCESFPIWNPSFISVRKLSKDSSGIGTLYLLERELPQGDIENTLEIIEYELNSRLAVETITGPAYFLYRYRFDPKGDSTKLSFHADFELDELPPRSQSPKDLQAASPNLKECLRALKTVLETGT